jgi:hypothetical protein
MAKVLLLRWLRVLAEREGFEPPELSLNGFQDRRHKPLGHLSVAEINAAVIRP